MDIIQHKNIIINNQNPIQHNHKQYDHTYHTHTTILIQMPPKRDCQHMIAYNTNTYLLWIYN